MRHIRSVVVLGASGTIGSLCGGLIAQCAIRVYFASRTIAGAKRGLRRAIEQARSEVISRYIECVDYEHGLPAAVEDADLIIEAVGENLEIKMRVYDLIERYRKAETIVGTTTSSLPLSLLVQGRSDDFKRSFLSMHFYNPPGRMTACETANTDFTEPSVSASVREFLESRLRRAVVPVKNIPAFAGNRIAFVLFNHLTHLAERFGVEMIDYLIGPYTGRLMPPFATIDLVGLDVHKAIIQNLRDYTSEGANGFTLPSYVDNMITRGLLGRKAGCGFYRALENGRKEFIEPDSGTYVPPIEPHVRFVEKAKEYVRVGRYREAFGVIQEAHGTEAMIVKEIIARYVSHAFSLVGEVTDSGYGMSGIDRVMSYGFNWAPPSGVMRLLGGIAATIELMSEVGVDVPVSLSDEGHAPASMDGLGRYFVAR